MGTGVGDRRGKAYSDGQGAPKRGKKNVAGSAICTARDSRKVRPFAHYPCPHTDGTMGLEYFPVDINGPNAPSKPGSSHLSSVVSYGTRHSWPVAGPSFCATSPGKGGASGHHRFDAIEENAETGGAPEAGGAP